MEQILDTEKTQTYEEFMAGVKRKTPLPKELRIKPISKGFPNLSKKDIFDHVRKGSIKIDFKSPFMKYDCGKIICTEQFFDLDFGTKEKLFEIWHKFYKKHTKFLELVKEGLNIRCDDYRFAFHSWSGMSSFLKAQKDHKNLDHDAKRNLVDSKSRSKTTVNICQ